ncbi:MAG TPA: dethiobiotin synthase [Betaproteobacteria bacterium]|nr:dethiobiotin synthase [Betaproteobacteria bacterium]
MTRGGYFVTGTDTGVGKTWAACALLEALAAIGKTVVGMKPVASGCDSIAGGLVCEDAEQLRRASTVDAPAKWRNPYRFLPPVSPHIAAAAAGRVIELRRIQAAYARLQKLADQVVVEGVGGFRAPLGDSYDVSALAGVLQLPVVLVVGLRLGCLNHALLTAEAIASRGLILAGWIANCPEPPMAAIEENLCYLERRLGAPFLGMLPYQPEPSAAGLGKFIDISLIV